jgi:hypothetical protein
MIAEILIARLAAYGCSMRLGKHGRLAAVNAGDVPEELREAVRRHRKTLEEFLRQEQAVLPYAETVVRGPRG